MGSPAINFEVDPPQKQAQTKFEVDPPASQAPSFLSGIPSGFGKEVHRSIVEPVVHGLKYLGVPIKPNFDTETEEAHQTRGAGEAVGKAGEQMAEMAVMGGPIKAAGKSILSHLPQAARYAAPAIRIGGEMLNAGVSAKMHDQPVKPAIAIGGGGAAIGEAASAVAPKLAESALGITGKMRGHGRAIGEAALNETSGVRPITIAKQAGQKLGQLTGELEQGTNAATQTGITGTTDAAHKILDDAIAKAPRNAPTFRNKLDSLRSLLDFNTGAGPQRRTFTPDEVLEMKRGIDKEISSWDHASKMSVDPVKRQLYRALDSELDKTVPGADELNQRISSLIPVKKRAIAISNNAPMSQRMAHRFAAHTGALAGGIGGAAIGYQHGGLPGAVGSGIAGIAIPEMIASPAAQMAVARYGPSILQQGTRAGITILPESEEATGEKKRKKED